MSTRHHSPLARALVHEVKKHTEGIDADVQITNERIGVLDHMTCHRHQAWDNGGIRCSYRQQPCCSVEACCVAIWRKERMVLWLDFLLV
jgi:hypothetical protein